MLDEHPAQVHYTPIASRTSQQRASTARRSFDSSPQPLIVPNQLQPYHSSTIPGGLTCLLRLDQLGIPYKSQNSVRGIQTPVIVDAPIGGITYVPMGRTPLLADCRLILALHRAAPYLQNLGVSEMHFSGAYSYRLMASGKPSMHALGLAIDVHRLRVNGEMLDLKEHFEVGRYETCHSNLPSLNRIGCLLKELGIFDWVLTPDFDYAHYNHFHLDIYPLSHFKYSRRDVIEDD